MRVIPHGAFKHLTVEPDERRLPPELGAVQSPVVLFFGLLRPYKGLDVLLEAWRGIDGAASCGSSAGPGCRSSRCAPHAPANVRFVPRYVSDAELPALLSPR